jgi:PAS domain-containing protein
MGEAKKLLNEAQEQQFRGISSSITAMAQLEFAPNAPVTGAGGVLDAVAVGLNLLAEELNTRVRDRERVDRVLDAIRDAVVVVTPDGTFRYLNDAARHLLYFSTADQVTGSLQDHLILPDSVAETDEELLPLDKTTGSIRRFLRRRARAHLPIIVSIAALPANDQKGFDGYVCILVGEDSRQKDYRWLAGTSETHVPFSVQGLIDELIAFHQPSAEAMGITFQPGTSQGLPPWVVGARAPLQNVLHSLIDASFLWTKSGKITLSVMAVTAPATGRTVLRFRIDNRDGHVDDSLRRKMFDPNEEPYTDETVALSDNKLTMKAASIVAESLGGKLGLQRAPDGSLVARLWIEMSTG